MKTRVFYDASCPICRREIDFYRRRRRADNIQWIDLSSAPEALPDGVTLREALAVFHVQMPDGRVLQGGSAFAALWRALPAFRVLGYVADVQPFRWILDRLYGLFLRYRKPTPAQCGLMSGKIDDEKFAASSRH